MTKGEIVHEYNEDDQPVLATGGGEGAWASYTSLATYTAEEEVYIAVTDYYGDFIKPDTIYRLVEYNEGR